MDNFLIVATSNEHKAAEIRRILSCPGIRIVTMKEAGIETKINEDGKTFSENAVIKASAVMKESSRAAIADDSGLVVDALGGAPGILSARYMGHDTSYDVKNSAIIEEVNRACRENEYNEYKNVFKFNMRNGGCGERERHFIMGRIHGNNTEVNDKGTNLPVLNRQCSQFAERPGCLEDGTPGPLRSARFVCAAALVLPDGKVFQTIGTMDGRIGYKIAGINGFGYDPIFYIPEYGKTSAELLPEEKDRISHRGIAFRKMRRYLLQIFH